MRLIPIVLGVWMSLPVAWADEPIPLAGTQPLTWDGELADRMMDGLHTFIESKVARAIQDRDLLWHRDPSSAAAYDRSLTPHRQRLLTILGVVDPRVSVRIERFGVDDQPAIIAERPQGRAVRVRWPVLDGVTAEGLLIEPLQTPLAHVIVLPDASQTPEELVLGPLQRFVWELASARVQVYIPVLIDRTDRWSGSERVAMTNQTHREWIWRQAYQMGRHILGFEIQKVLAAADWITSHHGDAPIAVVGAGEGGLIALYSAALDTRFKACLVSGVFEQRLHPWEEPIYRHVWSLTREFGDAELGAMVAPRTLIVEHSAPPRVDGPPPVRQGRRGGAAAGKIVPPVWESVSAEFQRMNQLVPGGFQDRILVSADRTRPAVAGEPLSPSAATELLKAVGLTSPAGTVANLPRRADGKTDEAERQRRQVQELEQFVQRLVRESDATREKYFPVMTLAQKAESPEEFAKSVKPYRESFRKERLGEFEERRLPLNPRTRQIYDRERWVGYDVVLDVYPDVFAWGVLLLPKDLQPGEKRPVVVCQHGRNGVPKVTIEGDEKAYHDYAARLADRGFIVFAPHNPYRGEDRYRFLSRKANCVGASLFSFILAQHQQILDWLKTLPQVDPERIAFYGLSYGGETAVRIPPLLDGYCLSICSADFNDWTRKIASTDARYSFMFTVEWEMPYFNLGSTFSYAEMVALLVPRPFMVERGHGDGVAPDEWVAYEYAKVRRLYDALKIGDRTEIEFFEGVHEIHGQGTFEFLERHLQWPRR